MRFLRTIQQKKGILDQDNSENRKNIAGALGDETVSRVKKGGWLLQTVNQWMSQSIGKNYFSVGICFWL